MPQTFGLLLFGNNIPRALPRASAPTDLNHRSFPVFALVLLDIMALLGDAQQKASY
jgi:hypothetical protein